MIYDNIDRGVYDLSNDKSGIRVGNEQYSVNKPDDNTPKIGTNNGGTMKIGTRNKENQGGGGCCG